MPSSIIRAAVESGSSESGTLLLVDNEGFVHAIRQMGHTKSCLGKHLFTRYFFLCNHTFVLGGSPLERENSTADESSQWRTLRER